MYIFNKNIIHYLALKQFKNKKLLIRPRTFAPNTVLVIIKQTHPHIYIHIHELPAA